MNKATLPRSFSLLLQVSRPRFWVYLIGPFFVGISWTEQSIIWFFRDWQPWVFLLFFLLPANLIVYGINDVSDSDTDTKNAKKGSQETLLQTAQQKVVLLGVSISIGLFSLLLYLSSSNNLAFLWLLTWLFLAVSYSAPPLRFKRRPFVDAYSNLLYMIPGFVSFSFFSTQSSVPILAIIVSLLWCAGMHTYSAIPDIAPDSKANLNTTAVTLGKNNALLFVLFNWLGAALLGFLLHPALGTVLSVYPVLIAYILSTSQDITNWYWKFPLINGVLGFSIFVFGAIVKVLNI